MVLQKNMRTCSSGPDWAGLPNHILDEVLDRLVGLRDYVRFAAVCLPWRSVAVDDDRNYRGNQRRGVTTRFSDHQLPMMMRPDWFDDKRARFYSVADEKEFEFELPVPYSKRFIGSSLGWLISVDTDFAITLFNPFSSTTIRLPPVIDPDVMSRLDQCDFDFETLTDGEYVFNHEYYFVKAVLSADPSSHPDEYVLMVIYGLSSLLAFIRPGGGNRKWVYLDQILSGFRDVIYSKSCGLFYALHRTGAVFTLSITDDDQVVFYQLPPDLETDRPCDLRYVVESSCGGDLLQVLRFRKISPWLSKIFTCGFKVFKLDKSTPIWYWRELESLGDDVLFLGDSASLSVTASDFPGAGCQPGCINFLLPFRLELLGLQPPFPDSGLPYDMAAVYLEGRPGTLHNIRYDYDVYNAIPHRPPIWIVPTFQAPAVKLEELGMGGCVKHRS